MNLVKEIHNSFSEADTVLLYEAEFILKELNRKLTKQQLDTLQKHFPQSSHITNLVEGRALRASNLRTLVDHYKVELYRFITESKVIELCRRHNLLWGDSGSFVGEIPVRNMQDIANFRMLDPTFLCADSDDMVWRDKQGLEHNIKTMDLQHLMNSLSFTSSKKQTNMTIELGRRASMLPPEEAQIFKYEVGVWKSYMEQPQAPVFYVVGDRSQFDMTRYNPNKDYFLERNMPAVSVGRTDYDPIVLARVAGGFLIVTAWGDEAHYPEVQNLLLN